MNALVALQLVVLGRLLVVSAECILVANLLAALQLGVVSERLNEVDM